ncbi:MAG: DUF1351 domain-containing protein [Pisciglobus halotolerans]|nr:DUF1351 domain-containing protein [Pisciglobus halotolerans]
MDEENVSFEVGEILVNQGSIYFPTYQSIKDQALDLSSMMKSVEVTNDNLKKSKQLLAAVRKEVNKLNDQRKKVKKDLLKPYEDLDTKVKEINMIVQESEQTIRQQVRQLEEQERQDKRDYIESIFNKRMRQYDFGELMGFDKFIKSSHLNKSTSLAKIEEEMVEWLTKTETNLDYIRQAEYGMEIIAEYQKSQDVIKSIKSVEERHKVIKEMERKVEQTTQQSRTKKPTVVIELVDEKDAKLVEMFMKQEGIDYSKSIR